MMSVSRLLTILLQSQFDHRHLQLWKALLSQNPRIFYIVLFVIRWLCLSVSSVIVSFILYLSLELFKAADYITQRFICPCNLIFFSSTLHLYCLCHFSFWKNVLKSFLYGFAYAYYPEYVKKSSVLVKYV